MGLDLNVKFGANIAMGGLISDGSAPMGISADLNLKGSKSAQKMEGVMNVNLFGAEYSENVLNYTATAEDGTVTNYSLDNESGTWTYTTQLPGSDSGGLSSTTAIYPGLFSDLALEPGEKGDAYYIVTGTLNAGDFIAQTDMNPEDMLGLAGFTDDLVAASKKDVVMSYDREPKELTNMALTFAPASFATKEIEVTELSMTLHVNSMDDAEIEIPDEVISSAVSMDMDMELDLGIDDEVEKPEIDTLAPADLARNAE